jgi:predicted RNase H-like nuclease
MTINELARIGARLKIKELMDEIKQVRAILKGGKVKLQKKAKKKLSPARRRAIIANLKKARKALQEKYKKQNNA